MEDGRRRMRLILPGLRWILAPAGLVLLLAAGCATRPVDDWVLGSGYQPANIFGRTRPLPPDFRRVAVLPLTALGPDLESAQNQLEPVLREELSRTKRFELVQITSAQLEEWTGRGSWSTAEVLPQELLNKLRDLLACDGVLFSQLTQFHAYPPLAVGWNLKLVEVKSGQVIWAADEVFDAGKSGVADGARQYQVKHSTVAGQLTDSRFILLSPTAFSHYSAQTLFAALPPERPAKVSSPTADNKK